MKTTIPGSTRRARRLCALTLAVLGTHFCTDALAEVGFETAQGWKLSTDGWIILQAHRQSGDTDETTGFRMTSGTTPSLFAFNVTAPAVDGVTFSGRVGLYINPQSGDGNFRNAGNVGASGSRSLDPREIWGKAAGSWGELVFGKAYGIYQGEAVLADPSVLAGGLTGYDQVNTTDALAASFNAGYLYTNFNAGLRYNSPKSHRLSLSVAIYDPSQIRSVFAGSAATQTKSPRIESGAYYNDTFGTVKIKVYGDAIYQNAQRCRLSSGAACLDDRVKTTGVSGGAMLDTGMWHLYASTFSAKGLGSVLMQDVDALDALGRARKSKGYYGQLLCRIDALTLRYSHGRTEVDDTSATPGHVATSDTVGAYYALKKYATVYAEVAKSKFTLNPVLGVPTDTRYLTLGGRFVW
jgi:hypothetical protein